MKKLNSLLIILFLIEINSIGNAQTKNISSITKDPTSYWQLSTRIGYDIPLYAEKFKFIDYSGGLMGGLSLNKYWKHWGGQLDFDYIRNTPYSSLKNTVQWSNGVTTVPFQVQTFKSNITRMFLGIGPSYKWNGVKNKFTLEIAQMAGIGFIDGGEILVKGFKNPPVMPIDFGLVYHSGFDNQKVFTIKSQFRATHFFNENWGVNFGAYYMNHFGVNESKLNPILIKELITGLNNTTSGFYYGQTGEQDGVFVGVPNSSLIDQREYNQDIDQQQKISISSIGLFAGLTYRFLPKNKEKKIAQTEGKFCLQVTAKDKFTYELIPNTDVALKNSKGVIISTSRTDAFGMTKFCDLPADDYSIAGVYNDIALEGNVAKISEFRDGLTINKDIIYADRNIIMKGNAVECNTTIPIQDLTVDLEKNDKSFKKMTLTDANGIFTFRFAPDGAYTLQGKKEGFFSQREEINASNYNRDKTLFVKLEICEEKADCSKAINLKNILFDIDRYEIKEIAKIELNKLVQFMKENPNVVVEIGSHTDCRSSNEHNNTLSQNRANSSVDYIVSQGIARNRIKGKGYGESKLLNECADGVQCSEAQHSINRRTEFKVICP